ncbi:MAG TPA: acyl-CoA dehydrogenase family protein [Polyangia bacterium]|nr:acyl-CoA dehydrogenase family protein [Polyangia bacterium]
MTFALSEIEEQVRATTQKLVREKLPIAHLRALRDSRDPIGFSRERWRELGRLGLIGATVGEAWGGAGLGWAALGLVLEECGRALAPLPWLSTIACAFAIERAGSDEQRRANLPAMCAGERLVAFAHEEGTRHSRDAIATRAERAPGGFSLRGEKVMVLDGHVADALLVSAGAADGPRLFLVAASAPGVVIERTFTVDSRNAARVKFDGVAVGEADAVGRAGADTARLVDALCDRAAIALSAEMLGGLEEVFERTLAYLKTRTQFGVPIGSFQALQHRMAIAWCEVELARAVVREALVAIDAQRDDVPLLACAAKARAADAFTLCAAEAIQLHGGIGVTDELDVGLFYKRARVAAALYGDAAWQRDRFARLKGY